MKTGRTIISKNIHADLSRERHFSNHSAKRDQYSPQIIGRIEEVCRIG